jgi:hypothetical protein
VLLGDGSVCGSGGACGLGLALSVVGWPESFGELLWCSPGCCCLFRFLIAVFGPGTVLSAAADPKTAIMLIFAGGNQEVVVIRIGSGPVWSRKGPPRAGCGEQPLGGELRGYGQGFTDTNRQIYAVAHSHSVDRLVVSTRADDSRGRSRVAPTGYKFERPRGR